jgi:putative endonuclease
MRAGSTAYHNGLAAEDIAIRLYEAQQGQILETRWKRHSGEIDLIVSLNGLIIFVEVKARKTLELAAQSISQNQQQRIFSTAQLYLAESGAGLNAETRFDVVIVDRAGQTEILENALAMGW